jgi:WD40 repeat protein
MTPANTMRRMRTYLTLLASVTLTAAGFTSPAAAAPASGKIVAGKVNGTLFLINPASGKAKRIGNPAWGDVGDTVRSANGEHLLGAVVDEAGTRVIRYDLSTGKMQRLGPFGQAGYFTGALDVSPDDRQVVTAVHAATRIPAPEFGPNSFHVIDGPLRLEAIDVSAGAVTPIITPFQPVLRQNQYTPGRTDYYMPDHIHTVRWSPDGRQIAFVHAHRWGVADGAADAPYHRLMIAPTNGSAPARELTRDFDEGSALSWSPDSEQLVVQSGAGKVELVDAATGALQVIARGKYISSPLLSPSGRRLAYRHKQKKLGPTVLKVRTLTTGRTITPKLVKGRLGHSFSWASSSDRLVASDDKGLAVVSAAGKVRRLPRTRGLSGPIWGRSVG